MDVVKLGGHAALFFGLALSLESSAMAEQVDAELMAAPSSLKAATVGAVTPLLLDATLSVDHALVVSDGGYDTSRRGGVFDTAAEARIWGPFALRVGVTYSDDTRRMRPSVGARVQLLKQSANGVDGSLSSFFKTEGFNEMEGEIETVLAIGHRFEDVYLLGNIAYGQDPEGNERDGELRASVLYPVGRAVLGVEGRGRSAIGAQHGLNSAVEPRIDLVGGPIATVTVGSYVFFAEVGPSAVKLQGSDLRWGVASIGGVGAVF